MRLYFDLTGYDSAHRREWQHRLAEFAASAPATVQLAGDAESADCIIETLGRQSLLGGRVFTIDPRSHFHRRPESTFVWDAGDFPTGLLPGLYTSLSQSLFDPARHRSFCYPLRYNDRIRRFSCEDAVHLVGFHGSMSSPLRYRIFGALRASAAEGTALLHDAQGGVWTDLFSGAADNARAAYATSLSRCKFFLCPRGNGLSSIRLFETMEAGRIPVILSDGLVLPQCVDWDRCAVVVPERAVPDLPRLLARFEPQWRELAASARRQWECNFGPAAMLDRLVAEIDVLRRARPRRAPTLRAWRRIAPQYLYSVAHSAVRHATVAVRRRHQA